MKIFNVEHVEKSEKDVCDIELIHLELEGELDIYAITPSHEPVENEYAPFCRPFPCT